MRGVYGGSSTWPLTAHTRPPMLCCLSRFWTTLQYGRVGLRRGVNINNPARARVCVTLLTLLATCVSRNSFMTDRP